MNYISNFPLPQNPFFNEPKEETVENLVENSIRSGNMELLQANLSDFPVNTPLPNGELPLHFAVRKGQAEMIPFLIEGGADPMVKDYQGLTAVDHAILQKNNDFLAPLLKKEIDEKLTIAINEQNTKTVQQALKKITKTTQEITSGKNQQPFSSVQQAVLSGDYERVKDLLENKTVDLREITIPQNLSLLHLSAMRSSPDIVDLLIKHDADVSAVDQSGRTAAHYAAINSNGAVFGRLAKQGADLSAKDNSGASPLALLGAAAQERDPLNVTRAHALMFVGAVAQTTATIAINSGLITEEQKGALSIVLIGGAFVGQWSSIAVHLQNIDKNWKKRFAFMGSLFLETVPFVGTSLAAWRTYNVVQSAFAGLKSAYNNVGSRTWKATRNAMIYTVNGSYSSFNLWNRLQFDYEVCLQAPYWLKMYSAYGNDEEYMKAYEEYLEFLRNRYNPDQDQDIGEIFTVTPEELAELSVIDRLNKENLNPRHPNHALMMISPEFTMAQLKEQGTNLYKKTYKNLMLKEVHPDKVKVDGIKAAAQRLNLAKETLDKWVKNNNP